MSENNTAMIDIYLDDTNGDTRDREDGLWYGYDNPLDDPWAGVPKRLWTVVRTVADCTALLEREKGNVDVLSLDYNLMGETGEEVLVWLNARLDADPTFPLPREIRPHTACCGGQSKLWAAIGALVARRSNGAY